MSDALKVISGLDMAVFAIFMIIIRYVFSKFSKMEIRIIELSEISHNIRLIEYKINDLSDSMRQITEIHIKNKKND